MSVRRWVRWAGGGLIFLAIMALLVTAVMPGLLRPNPAGSDLTGYPERIAKPYAERSLPTRSGPLAAIVEDNDFGNVRYHGVDEHGRVWQLPRTLFSPALSPDGRQLLGIEGDVDPRLTLIDLASGERRRFDEVGSDSRGPEDGARAPYRLSHDPAAWSPDGLRVAMTTSHGGSRHVPIVIDLQSGRVQELPLRGTVAGWKSDDEIVVVRHRSPKGEGHVVTASVVNQASGRIDSVILDPTISWRWSSEAGSLSPNGALLIPDNGQLHFFELSTGATIETRVVKNVGSGRISWLGEDPVVGTKVYGTPARSVLVTKDTQRSLVAIDPRFQSNAIYWASDAINGKVHTGLWGTNSARWTWYWREGLALILAVALVTILAMTRRRRTT